MSDKTKTMLKIIGTAILALMVLTLIARGAGKNEESVISVATN